MLFTFFSANRNQNKDFQSKATVKLKIKMSSKIILRTETILKGKMILIGKNKRKKKNI